MNERIKELAEQANAWYPMGYPSGEGGDAAWENLVIFEKEDLEKFAELIVRECVSVIQEELDSGQYSQPVHTGFRVSKNMIKEHFGVEE